jgi:hypothetical protein
MKLILTGTLATFVLGAAIASSQTPAPAGQAPAPPAQTQPAQPAGEPAQKATPAKPQTTTYKGVLKGSAASGFTISPIAPRSAASSTAGATATAGGADQVTYTVIVTDPKVDLAGMADDCVEVAGVLGPEPSPAGAGAAGAAKNRILTVTTIKEAEGCK